MFIYCFTSKQQLLTPSLAPDRLIFLLLWYQRRIGMLLLHKRELFLTFLEQLRKTQLYRRELCIAGRVRSGDVHLENIEIV